MNVSQSRFIHVKENTDAKLDLTLTGMVIDCPCIGFIPFCLDFIKCSEEAGWPIFSLKQALRPAISSDQFPGQDYISIIGCYFMCI